MSVVRWDPLRELEDVQRSISRLFDARSGADLRAGLVPVDVYETAAEVVVRADLPGVQPGDIQVQQHDGQLYIRALRRAEAPEGASWLVHQTPEGELTRSFAVGVPVEVGGVEASFDAGVLEVHLPKAEHARPREIPVKVTGPAMRTLGARRTRAGEPEPGDGSATR